MNIKLLVPIGLVFGVVIMGLTGVSRPFSQLDLWLDQRDAPVTAQANALSPLIACVNRVDVQWRVAYDLYKTPQPPRQITEQWLRSLSDFEDSDARNVRDIQRDLCSGRLAEKLELLAYQPELAQTANAYVRALDQVAMTIPSGRFDRGASFVTGTQNAAALIVENAFIPPVADSYNNASIALRESLLPLDAAQRPEQLKRLEERVGKDIHWYLLAYMMQARETIDVLDAAMKNRTLTPQLLADTTAKLQQAWDRREPFLVAQTSGGFQTKTDAARDLWLYIGKPSTVYLQALNTLHKDWQEHAPPQRLSDDFYAVSRSYDGLLSYYNRRARAEF